MAEGGCGGNSAMPERIQKRVSAVPVGRRTERWDQSIIRITARLTDRYDRSVLLARASRAIGGDATFSSFFRSRFAQSLRFPTFSFRCLRKNTKTSQSEIRCSKAKESLLREIL